MAPTPYFLFGAAPEDTPAADTSAHAVVPDLSDALAQAASVPGRHQAASRGGGGAPPRKTPQRGLGVAELERLRCGGAPPRKTSQRGLGMAELERLRCAQDDLNAAAAAANLQAQANSVVLQQQHHHHDYLPAFDAASCLHAGQRCDLCSKTMMGLADRGTRATTTNAPYYSISDLAATMTAVRKETAGEGFLAAEGRKEVREVDLSELTDDCVGCNNGWIFIQCLCMLLLYHTRFFPFGFL